MATCQHGYGNGIEFCPICDSMTGDGAVVRELVYWPATETCPAYVSNGYGSVLDNEDAVEQYNHTIRQQVAEIKRLTASRDIWMQAAYYWRPRAEASEARTAALLKALERYGEHDGRCEQNPRHNLTDRKPCDCGLAAAKGGTV